jgi:hypothetical protein
MEMVSECGAFGCADRALVHEIFFLAHDLLDHV